MVCRLYRVVRLSVTVPTYNIPQYFCFIDTSVNLLKDVFVFVRMVTVSAKKCTNLGRVMFQLCPYGRT